MSCLFVFNKLVFSFKILIKNLCMNRWDTYLTYSDQTLHNLSYLSSTANRKLMSRNDNGESVETAILSRYLDNRSQGDILIKEI